MSRSNSCLISTLILIIIGFAMSNCSQKKEPESGNSVPEDMVLVPAGKFTMGGKSDQAYKDEFPRHQVEVSAFYMDETEVTNIQFEEFVDATGYRTIAEQDIDWEEMKMQLPEGTPKPADSVLAAGSLVFQQTSGPVDLNNYTQWWVWTTGADWRHPEGPGSSIENRMNHPAVHIAWEDAKAYAEWAGKRLPTEAEWEWAAMGGLDDPKYPWGNESVENASDKANFWQGKFPYHNMVTDGFEGTAPVKTFPANGYGLYEMSGNVWEWCQDKYNAETYSKYAELGLLSDPKGSPNYYDPHEPHTPKHVIRGGSFLCNDDYCSGYRVSRRMSSSKDSGFNHTGFRCVRDTE